MENCNLIDLIHASHVHKKVSKYVFDNIKTDTSLKDIVLIVEEKSKEEIKKYIEEKKLKMEATHTQFGIAFPVGVSMNNVVAHYTPNYLEKEIIFTEKDILKIDFGIHFQGSIIDSAFNICFDSEVSELVDLSKKTTAHMVSLCGPDKILSDLGREIEEYVKSKEITIRGKTYQCNTIRELSGHSIKKYNIHGGVAVPNTNIKYPVRMVEGWTYAIEPFISVTDKPITYDKPISHYMLNPYYKNNFRPVSMNKSEKDYHAYLFKKFNQLPFCQRWLYEFEEPYNHDDLLKELVDKKVLNEYPTIYDTDLTAQTEHTIFVKGNGIINLTANSYY